MSLNPASTLALGCVLAFATQGCRAQREMLISSEPPGAQIRLDDTLLSVKTPAHVPFKDYGVRRVTLYLDGYLTYSESVDIVPPWYAYFPLDLVSEILLPIGWHDRHKLRVQMVKGDMAVESPDLVNVMQRAEVMRRAGPDGLKVVNKHARTLPHETSGVSEPAPEPAPLVPPEKPADPPGTGGIR